jgi:LacI family transcriptional regulator
MMPDATIYDVAETAGVSISTVSRVLNAPEQVHEATRVRVLAAIDQLNFVPRAEATARARKGTQRIGVLAPFFTYPSFVQRLRGVANALAGSRYEMVIYNVESAVRRDGHLAALPITRRIDGLIVMSLPFEEKVAQRLVAHGLQVVLIEFSHALFSSIEIDDQFGGRLVARYLLDQGHRRCAFVGDSDVPVYSIHTSDERLDGYRQGLIEGGLDLPDHYISRAPHGMESARRQTHDLLDLPDPPTAIFSPSDTQAMGVLRAARERGVKVPGDLAVIGFDDVEFADYIGLTTVRQPLEESGRVAVDLLLARLSDSSRPVQRVSLPLMLVRRETA